MQAFEVILLFFFVSNPMEKRVERLGYEVAFIPPGDGDCFYASGAKTLGIETQGPEEGDLRLSEEFTTITDKCSSVVTTLQPANFPRLPFLEMKPQMKYRAGDSI